MNESPVHHALAGANLDRRHGLVGAVAALGGALDGREILVVVVAVAQEEEMLQAGAPFQAQGVAAEELAGDADETDPAVEQRRGEVWPHPFAVLALIEVHKALEERRDEDGLYARV